MQNLKQKAEIQVTLDTYLRQRASLSYYGFLLHIREEIIASPIVVDKWRRVDDYWFTNLLKLLNKMSNSNISTASPANNPSYKASTSSTDERYIEEGIKKSRAYTNLIEERSFAESDGPVLQVIFEERFLPIHYVPELFM
ncbi:5475_t:CDS:2, partial [Dentiscutata erythropus]